MPLRLWLGSTAGNRRLGEQGRVNASCRTSVSDAVNAIVKVQRVRCQRGGMPSAVAAPIFWNLDSIGCGTSKMVAARIHCLEL